MKETHQFSYHKIPITRVINSLINYETLSVVERTQVKNISYAAGLVQTASFHSHGANEAVLICCQSTLHDRFRKITYNLEYAWMPSFLKYAAHAALQKVSVSPLPNACARVNTDIPYT